MYRARYVHTNRGRALHVAKAGRNLWGSAKIEGWYDADFESFYLWRRPGFPGNRRQHVERNRDGEYSRSEIGAGSYLRCKFRLILRPDPDRDSGKGQEEASENSDASFAGISD